MTKDEVGKARAVRWARYGRLGQYSYAKALLTGIAQDTECPKDLRTEAKRLNFAVNDLMKEYKRTLK